MPAKRPRDPEKDKERLLKQLFNIPPPKRDKPGRSKQTTPPVAPFSLAATDDERNRIEDFILRGVIGDFTDRSHKRHLLKIMAKAIEESAECLFQCAGKRFYVVRAGVNFFCGSFRSVRKPKCYLNLLVLQNDIDCGLR